MSVHNIAVQSILDRHPEAVTKGFMDAVAKALDERFPETIIPEAYLVEAREQTITAFEVEDSHPIPEHKMARYTRLWWWMDGMGWTLALRVCGRWGDDLRPVDLLTYSLRAKRLQLSKSA
jgi:hypothetical protein